jgi:hypothetical protein
MALTFFFKIAYTITDVSNAVPKILIFQNKCE